MISINIFYNGGQLKTRYVKNEHAPLWNLPGFKSLPRTNDDLFKFTFPLIRCITVKTSCWTYEHLFTCMSSHVSLQGFLTWEDPIACLTPYTAHRHGSLEYQLGNSVGPGPSSTPVWILGSLIFLTVRRISIGGSPAKCCRRRAVGNVFVFIFKVPRIHGVTVSSAFLFPCEMVFNHVSRINPLSCPYL